MNKQVLTLGIILSVGTAGCAGFGYQSNSSLSAQLRSQDGIDDLWTAADKPVGQGLETPRYADQTLGVLWQGRVAAPDTVRINASHEQLEQGDLWNPSTVVRSWEINEGDESKPSRDRLLGDTASQGIWY